MIKVAIVDDKQPNRVSLSEKLGYLDDFEVSFLAANGQDFLNRMKALKPALRPDVVMMDIDMPVMTGIEALSLAHDIYPATRFLMLTVFDDDDKIFDAIKAGAIGYLLKDEKVDTIIEAIREVVDCGGAPMSPSIARKALNLLMQSNLQLVKTEAPGNINLSEREKEILKLLVEGMDYKMAAETLFISPHTVRKHIANIYEKLHVCNRTQAVKVAIRNKWF